MRPVIVAPVDAPALPPTWVSPELTSGLGNRLFQYAAAAGLAETWARPVAFYLPELKACPHGSASTLFKMYPQVPLIESNGSGIYELKEHPRRFYDYMPFGQPPAMNYPVVVRGFRQSPLYFPRDLSRLEPNWDSALGGASMRRYIEGASQLASEEEQARTVSLHVRLGDYRKLPHHQEDLALYYMRALEKVPAGSRLHLFSDEPELCSGTFAVACRARGLHFSQAAVRSDIESLYEMSLCRGGNICANSTFSWWGAWFAHAAGSPWATMPDKWGAGMPEPTDLFPEWADIIPTKG